MKTIGLVCEFNPFHHGHAGLLSAIRREFGEDATIVAVMSGHFVQRGEPAMFEKYTRAETALTGGCDLVIELPFPASTGSAERFAGAAISVLNSLGEIDILAFGSECGDVQKLSLLAAELEAPVYRDAYAAFSQNNSIGGAKRIEVVYETVYGRTDRLSHLRRPNDVLGVEYIRALMRLQSRIRPYAFPRIGAAHGETELPDCAPITSATEARRLLANEKNAVINILSRLPHHAARTFEREINAGKIVADDKKWKDLLLLHCRMADPSLLASADGLSGGLASRILRAAGSARNGEEFFAAIRTKKYTDAFLRRALLSAFFGIGREELNAPPAYAQILGTNDRGRQFLARVRRKAEIPLLTKPADYRLLPSAARLTAERAFRADGVYAALLHAPVSPADFLRRQPVYIACQTPSNDFLPPPLDKL